MTIISLDGVKIKLEAPDLDKDGIVGEVETVTQKMGGDVTNITQPTEVGEVMKTMFPEDNLNNTTKMLGNISANEEQYVLAFLILRTLGVTPYKSRDIVIEKLLLSVSRNARGRDDGRDIMIGKREQDIKMGGMGRMGEGVKSFFGMQGGK